MHTRPSSRAASVNRHTGGLENIPDAKTAEIAVNRHTGGLEIYQLTN